MRYFNNLVLGLFLSVLLLSSCAGEPEPVEVETGPEFVFLVHGGAGVFNPDNLPDGREEEYLDAVNKALDIGRDILAGGGTALDAVEKAIVFLEDNPIFNAGKGAVFTADGTNELDASIMDGISLNAGAVGGVKTVKNPITAARKVMEVSPHVLLVGSGAEQFSASQGYEIVDPGYFYTAERFDVLQRVQQREAGEQRTIQDKTGTVGAVARDKHGNLAAGTSTGGMTNKRFGRIGDSPIIGAGTYADNSGVAVSCTGHGEYFIRHAIAYDLNALYKYREISLDSAASFLIHKKLPNAGGTGGLIAVDTSGNYSMPFNTNGMIRGVVTSEHRESAVYRE
nr:isoaspartyl peptidase/L-asparaginase [Saprospiraceae bacterium]